MNLCGLHPPSQSPTTIGDARALVAGPHHTGSACAASQDRAAGRRRQIEQGHRRRIEDRHEDRLPVAQPLRRGGVWRASRRTPRAAVDRHARTAALAAEIVRKTTTEKPAAATHWSTRTLAAELGTSPSMVQRVWKANDLQPHRTKTFKLSNDPRFAEKLVDVVGLYLNPPEHAIVLCVDEKSQIQALDRTQKGLPIHPGRLGTMTHDYKRHGTTTLFAALDVAEGIVIEACMSRHRHQEWIKFLEDRRRDRPAGRTALGRRQLRDPQAPQGAAVAGASSTVSHALHADQQFLAEPGRALVSRADAEASASAARSRRPPTPRGHLRVRRASQ